MKRAFIVLVAILGCLLSAFAQTDSTWHRRFSIELGTGLQPLHASLITPTREEEIALAEQGKEAEAYVSSGAYYPTFSLSAVWNTAPRTEFTVSLGITWCHCKVTQYPAFGTDPQGKPRYDLGKGTDAGWMNTSVVPAIVGSYRHLWNPNANVVLYSGLSLGLVDFVPMPGITLIAARYGGRHFYGFAEVTIGPLATFIHGGIAWRF